MSGIKQQLKIALAKANYKANYLKLLNLFKDNFRILTYHRILDRKVNPYQIEDGMFVLPETFALQLEFLKKNYQLLSLEELIYRLENNKKIFKKTIIITIDDGWYDNYQFAYPLIKSTNVPVSIFLATGFIGTNELFWTDHLIYLLTLHQENRVNLENKFLQVTDYDKLISNLKLQSEAEIEKIIKFLTDNLAKNNIDTEIKFRTFLNWEEIKEMQQDKNISFYSHSHSHRDFSKLTEQEILADLKLSFAAFKNKAMECPKIFCYPGGAYNELSQKALRGLEIKYALITEGKNNLKNSPKTLKRINIHDDITATKELFKFRIEF